jgi:hypothetical protein
MRRIVYLTDQPFDDRNYQRYGIQAWIDRGWSVEVWDLTPWAHPRFWHSFLALGHKIRNFAGYYPIASAKVLKARLAASGQLKFFIDTTGESYCSMRAVFPLVRIGATRVTCSIGSIPRPDHNEPGSTITRIAKVLGRGPRFAFNWLSSAFFTRVIAPRIPPGLAIVTGEYSITGAARGHRLIRAHNRDYDTYLQLVRSGPTLTGNYAVFIDQDYCFHPEMLISRTTMVTPEKYFPTMRRGLREISRRLNLEIRIAAHPRAAYEHRGMECFGDFPLEYGRTAELIQGCGAVVCHDSTAIQFGVLFAKPLIFVTTDELRLSFGGSSTDKVSSEFGKVPINLDSDDLQKRDWDKEIIIDSRLYADYKRRYIKADGSPEIPLWDIVINHIEVANP